MTAVDGRPLEPETERRSNAHLAALINQTIAGIAETDLTGRFVLVNDRYCEIVGYPREELLAGLRTQDITHADDLPGYLQTFEWLATEGEPFAVERRYVRKDGTLAWVHNSVSAVRDAGGRIASALAVDVEVTERNRAAAELRSNEARLRALADATASAIWTVAPTGEVLDQSVARWAYLTDLPAAELAAEWLAAVHPDDREPGNARWWAGIAEARSFEFEQRVRQRDGSWRHFTVRAVPVRGDDGQIREWVGADVDITERKRAEAELRDREELLRLTLQAARAGAWVLDPATGREAWSREIFPLLGCHPGEIEPAFDSLLAVVHPDDRELLRKQATSDIPAGRDGQAEFRIIHPDESVHWILSRGRTILDAAGAPRRVGLMLDVTERKRAEDAVRASEERQTFLLRLSDALRPLVDPDELLGHATHLVGERLGADRAYYVEIDDIRQIATVGRDYVRGHAQSLAGSYPFASFAPILEAMRSARPVVADDAWADPRFSDIDRPAYTTLSMRSFISVPLFKADRLVAAMCVADALPRAWTAEETAQLQEVAERTWEAMERAHADAALRQSEERYRTLFDRIDQGFCVIELLVDDDGRPRDYRFLEVNPTFARHTGLTDAVGRTAREIVPGLEDHWVEMYGQVARTGERRRFEQGSAAMGRWFEVEAVRVGGDDSRRVALLFSDVTDRKQTEEALREGVRQAAYRAALADALRPLSDPAEIQATASRLLGEHLNVSRALFAEGESDGEHVVVRQDYANGVRGASGRYRLAEFGMELAAAASGVRSVVVADVAAVGELAPLERATYAMLDVRAYAAVSLVKNGRLAVVLAVGDAEPRAWTAGDVALLEETAERTWAAVERATAETALRESERRLQSLADAMPQVVWAADPDGVVKYYNSRVTSFAGVAQTAPGTWDWQPTVHPDDLAPTIESWQRATRDTSPYVQEHRILMTGGEYRWHLSRAVPILDASGQIETWYGTATDIHDLKQAEIALRQNEERLRLGIDVAGFALLEVDYESDVIHLSMEAARLYGLGEEAVTVPRDRVHAAFHPDDRGELTRRIAAGPAANPEEPFTTEYRVVWPTGEVRWLSVRKQIIVDQTESAPRPVRAVLAALDITARKQAESDRQALLDALAHDLRNPLTALKMQAQLLLRQFERGKAPVRDVLVERIAGFLDLSERMTGLIDDLEEHAHLGLGDGVGPDRQATDVVDLARTSVAELQQSGATHSIRVDTDEPELVGFWDPLHVRRVLDNLLGNAVKYSPDGSHVRIRLFRAGRHAVIEVRDEGIGIPADDLPHIFGFRYRGGNVGAVAGSGVGLAGVKQIVERHGGTVTVQSEKGRGSVFTVRLPLLVSGR